MVGLSRNADHHLHTSKPFFKLQLVEQSPKLPYGYFAMIFFKGVQNRRFQAMAKRELQSVGVWGVAGSGPGVKNEILGLGQ